MDAPEFFHHLEEHHHQGLPFVSYKKPNENKVKAMFLHTDELFTIHNFIESGFVFAPFDDSSDAILFPLEKSKIHETIFENEILQKKFKQSIPTNEESKQFHLKLVQKGIDAIKGGKLSKVVLSRRETLVLESPNPITLFQQLLSRYHTAFVYLCHHPKVGLWLGATPELLFSLNGNQLSTMALAGTQTFNGTTDVVWQKKEREEQQFVTDYIVEQLKPFSSKTTISAPETIRAGNLLHLRTTITCNLIPIAIGTETTNLKPLLQAIHPTPAVCGIPKEKAKQFILQHENYNREFYTGFLGELNLMEHKNRNTNRRNVENNAYKSYKRISNLYVNLRCMQIEGNSVHIYVGGGITKDSLPENEWLETAAKAETVKKVIKEA